jgi:hypothetical protein
VLTTKYWGLQGVSLTVGFLDDAAADLRRRILLHMNAWAKTANVKFVEKALRNARKAMLPYTFLYTSESTYAVACGFRAMPISVPG